MAHAGRARRGAFRARRRAARALADDDELRAEGALFEKRSTATTSSCCGRALLVPSFMGSRPVAGMHGYDAKHPDMTALLASNRELPADVRHLADLRGFLERELDALATEAA